jgi:hypothetical protein
MTEPANPVNGVRRIYALVSADIGPVMGLQGVLLLMSFSFLLILSAPLFYVSTELFQWSLSESDVWSNGAIKFLKIFLNLFAFNLVIPIFIISAGYLYFSLSETQSAGNLKIAIAALGNKYFKGVHS